VHTPSVPRRLMLARTLPIQLVGFFAIIVLLSKVVAAQFLKVPTQEFQAFQTANVLERIPVADQRQLSSE